MHEIIYPELIAALEIQAVRFFPRFIVGGKYLQLAKIVQVIHQLLQKHSRTPIAPRLYFRKNNG